MIQRRIGRVIAGLIVASLIVFSDLTAQPSRENKTQSSAPTITKEALLSPPKEGGPVVIHAAFHLQDINNIDDEAETFQFTGGLWLRWKDQRQAFDPNQAGVTEKIYQGNFQFDEISPAWYPQIILVNEAGSLDKQAVLLRVLPDGTSTLSQTIRAVAEAKLSMRRYPFDRQRLEAKFRVLGFDETEVKIEVEPRQREISGKDVRISQWQLLGFNLTSMEQPTPNFGNSGSASTLILSMEMQREAFFVVRLVVLPLALIVLLSMCVFWMERASLGDRINVSFIGILTAVAYQMVMADILPHISYMTLLNGFVNISLLVMCAAVVMNLVVGSYERQGRIDMSHKIDSRCRWIFPTVYIGWLSVITAIAFIFF